ncbi:hypothetical protein BS47DRAFT_1362072 [Hydnum rufescens UP504]|uniref:Uncharacterized protein n=1 Tax=Hydnum rufescens UP504 TaxID=1448309 RepID=A0A9P6B088_9AGAM|nr:hypothetical protein BS47DRAFT_1362072 [Hydnum rufescens UP504]
MGMDTISSEGFPSQYGLLRIRQTVDDLLSRRSTWQREYLDAVRRAAEAPPEHRAKAVAVPETRVEDKIRPGGIRAGNCDESTSGGIEDWARAHEIQVDAGDKRWISAFGGRSDPELSDVEDTGLGTLLAEDVLAEHRRRVAANDKNWIEVFGSSTDVELSEDEGGGMEDGEKMILHQLADSMGGFFFPATRGVEGRVRSGCRSSLGGDFGTLGTILKKQFASYANSIVALHNGDASNVAVADYAAVADLLSTDLTVGRYLAGQLILNHIGAEIEKGGEAAVTAQGNAVHLLRVYLTCVLGPSHGRRISNIRGFLVQALPPVIKGIYGSRTASLKETRTAAHRAKELVSVLFVRPQNGPKNLSEHAQAGKYAITTPDGKFPKGVKDEIRRNSFFVENPTYISPIFRDDANGSSSTANPLLGRGERRPYAAQVVLVFQLPRGAAAGIFDGGGGKTDPLGDLHRMECFVTASIFYGHGLNNAWDVTKIKKELSSSSQKHKPFVRGGDRPHRGKGSSIGARADQRGHIGNFQEGVSEDTRAKISTWDENTIDHLTEVVNVVFPKLIEEDYLESSYRSSVPPSGARGFAASGAAGSNFLAAQHIEPYTDPEWTMGMTLSEGDRCPMAYNFCFSALDNGRGVIALNYAHTAHIWKGKKFLHGGTVGPSTFTHEEPVIGLGVYQKSRMQAQARKDAAMFPKSFKMAVGRAQRFEVGALRWIV